VFYIGQIRYKGTWKGKINEQRRWQIEGRDERGIRDD
jgi:hypothetical protein